MIAFINNYSEDNTPYSFLCQKLPELGISTFLSALYFIAFSAYISGSIAFTGVVKHS